MPTLRQQSLLLTLLLLPLAAADAPDAAPPRIAILISGQLCRFAYQHTNLHAFALPLEADVHAVLSRTTSSRVNACGLPYPADEGLSDEALSARIRQHFWERAGVKRFSLVLLTADEIDRAMQAVDREVERADPELWQRAAGVRAQSVLRNAGPAVVRWVSNGRMLYLRHAAFAAALREERERPGARYSFFLYLRDDNAFLSPNPLPPAALPLSGLEPGFVGADEHCGFSGHPSDKVRLERSRFTY